MGVAVDEPVAGPGLRGDALTRGLAGWERNVVLTAVNEARLRAGERWPSEHGFGRVEEAGNVAGRAVLDAIVKLRPVLGLDEFPPPRYPAPARDPNPRPDQVESNENHACGPDTGTHEPQECRREAGNGYQLF